MYLKKLSVIYSKIKESARVGFFLATRSLLRSNKATAGMVITIQIVTILNLVVVQGILVGIVEGGNKQFREQYSGDILITPLADRTRIQNTSQLINAIENLSPHAYSVRYLERASIIDNYRDLLPSGVSLNKVSNNGVIGIDPLREDALSGISQLIVEGRWLLPSDSGGIVIGADLLKRYNSFANAGQRLLEDSIVPGAKVKVELDSERAREFTVIGIVKSKVDQISARAYVLDRDLLNLSGRENINAGEIAIRLPQSIHAPVAARMLSEEFPDAGIIQDWQAAIPQALKEVSATFTGLGQMVGAIGLLVATITMFIVTFVNVVTRRKFIGILKATGVSAYAIEFSYILQAVFYAVIGSTIGALIIGLWIKPYFDVHPFDFPFTDGILATDANGITLRATIICLTSALAGYWPARKITSENTLNAILGRS